MRSSNPVLRNDTFAPSNWGGAAADLARHEAASRGHAQPRARAATMSLGGVVLCTSILLVLCVASALASWRVASDPASRALAPWIGLGGMGLTLIISLVIAFVPRSVPYLSPIHAVAEGAFVGYISHFAATAGMGRGLPIGEAGVFQAVLLTFGTLGAMLLGYQSGLLKMGRTMRNVVLAATGGIAIAYLINAAMYLLGFDGLGFIHSTGPLGIAFSAVVLVVAALNLVLDFERTEEGIQRGAPRYMNWYMGYALLVTIVWLYIEFLRLLSKLRKN